MRDKLLTPLECVEHRAGIEPANTGFADQRVSHFATGALSWPIEYRPEGNTK